MGSSLECGDKFPGLAVALGRRVTETGQGWAPKHPHPSSSRDQGTLQPCSCWDCDLQRKSKIFWKLGKLDMGHWQLGWGASGRPRTLGTVQKPFPPVLGALVPGGTAALGAQPVCLDHRKAAGSRFSFLSKRYYCTSLKPSSLSNQNQNPTTEPSPNPNPRHSLLHRTPWICLLQKGPRGGKGDSAAWAAKRASQVAGISWAWAGRLELRAEPGRCFSQLPETPQTFIFGVILLPTPELSLPFGSLVRLGPQAVTGSALVLKASASAGGRALSKELRREGADFVGFATSLAGAWWRA